jgi:hypothetical protein
MMDVQALGRPLDRDRLHGGPACRRTRGAQRGSPAWRNSRAGEMAGTAAGCHNAEIYHGRPSLTDHDLRTLRTTGVI